MTARAKLQRTFSRTSLPLTNSVSVEKGEMACLDTSTGLVTKGSTSTTLMPIGWFAEDLDGDGSTLVDITLFQEVVVQYWDNDDSPNDVASTDRGTEVYIKDDRTVSTSSASSTRSVAGRVWSVDAIDGVGIQQGMAVTGPTGPSGSALASGGVADRAALAAVAAASRFNGELVLVRSDNSLWRFDSAGTADEDEAQELVVAPDAGTGRWIRADKAFVAKIPIGFGNTDGEAIWTIPAGFAVKMTGLPFYDITTAFTGGSSAAIGVSTSITGYDTKGDVIGGASGDVLAGLTAGVRAGTLGGELNDTLGLQQMLFVEADELQFDRITDAFTAGAGFLCMPVAVCIPA